MVTEDTQNNFIFYNPLDKTISKKIDRSGLYGFIGLFFVQNFLQFFQFHFSKAFYTGAISKRKEMLKVKKKNIFKRFEKKYLLTKEQ